MIGGHSALLRESLPKAVTANRQSLWSKDFLRNGEDLRKIQKPRSARPTQLNAKIEQAIAANDARVVTALTKRMSRVLCEIDLTLFNDLSAMMASTGRDE
jgi:hypothetical protein